MSTEETTLNGTAELPTTVEIHGDMMTSQGAFEHVQRVAKVFAASKLVPATYQNNIADCIIALQMAHRMNIDPFTFMQNTYVVHGKPAIEGKFAIALVNKLGPYPDGIKFKTEGTGDELKVTAWAKRENGEIDQCTVSYEQAKGMGWIAKNPLWKQMPEQMLHYRAGSWLARRYCPEVLMGLQTTEEAKDVIDITPSRGSSKLTERLKAKE